MRWSLVFLFLLALNRVIGADQDPQALMDSVQQIISVDPKRADSLAREILKEVERTESHAMLGRINYQLGLINYYLGLYQLSSKYYRQALQYLQLPEDANMESAIWNNLGINHEFAEEFDQAVAAYLKSLDYALSQGDSTSIYQSYLNLGLMYAKLADFKASENYLQTALNYFSRQGDLYNTALASQNLGILYKTINQESEAKQYFLQAMSYIQKLDNPAGLASLYNDYMYYLLEIEDYKGFESSIPGYQNALAGINNDYILASANTTFGQFEFKANKNYPAAINYFLKALEPLQTYEAVPQLSVIYPGLIESYLQTGHKAKVSATLKKYEDFLTRHIANESAEKIAELRAVHEVAQKEAETEVLKVKLEQKNRVILLSLMVAGLFICISAITYYFLQVVKNKERALVARSLELADLVEQKESTDPQSSLSSEALGDAVNRLQMQELFERIKDYIVQQEKFLDPNLKMSDVAFALGSNDKYISKATLQGSKMRFNAFVNFYRINRAKKLLRTDKPNPLTIGDVAKNSGFSHQSAFQRKFKEYTGVTPYTFQRLARIQQNEGED